MGVQISICIPAYKRIDFLRRLLDSISTQTFRDFEVIVTDDSPDEAVRQLCGEYQSTFVLQYFRNERQLGTPENWNEAIRKAGGAWIKIMHDDDWFAGPDSLGQFAAATAAHPAANFFFCAYRDVFLDDDREREMFLPRGRYKAFLRNRSVLFAKNIIGPPSVVMYRRLPLVEFDARIKWVVDIDFYIRYLEKEPPVYIDTILVNVGLGKMQVTQAVRVAEVEIPENFYLLGKIGYRNLRNILVYDAFWRLIRNLGIRSGEDIVRAGYHAPVPEPVLSMIAWQRRAPVALLKIGPLSKTLMFVNFCLNRPKISAGT